MKKNIIYNFFKKKGSNGLTPFNALWISLTMPISVGVLGLPFLLDSLREVPSYHSPLSNQEILQALHEPILPEKTLKHVQWYVVDLNGDGEYDQLITPHRNDYYGFRGPIYSKKDTSPKGKEMFENAKELVRHKEEFSKLGVSEGIPYWLCRIDDYNGDSIVDKISWPRIFEKAKPLCVFSSAPDFFPFFYPDSLQKKANRALSLEMKIQNYISKQYNLKGGNTK